MWKITVLFVCIATAATCSVFATGIAYDGELSANGAPADGWFDFHFRVFDAQDPEQSQPLGNEAFVPGILVTGGSFSVEVDPGADLGGLSDVWLEIGVKQAGAFGDFTILEPRQRLMLRPAKQHTTKAGTTPTGAIVFFSAATCPPGWTEYVAARGRFVLGLPQDGTVGATFGTPLSNLEDRKHTHFYMRDLTTSASGGHTHAWATLSVAGNGDRHWSSYNASGNSILATTWGNGVGNEGSGIYPLAAQPTQTFYTSPVLDHQHYTQFTGNTGEGSMSMPFVQLLTCQKD